MVSEAVIGMMTIQSLSTVLILIVVEYGLGVRAKKAYIFVMFAMS